MKFEFDHNKSQMNTAKHGISLEDAKKLWFVPGVEIEARTQGESRFMLVGQIKEKCYSCIFTKRGETIRLISARRSRKSEEDLYYDHIKV
jgi:uncharacterized DUF497 family protein